MFPFTQLSNIYTKVFYTETQCNNSSCNKILYTLRGNMIPTHCSISCGYNDNSNYLGIEQERIEKQKQDKIDKEKQEQDKIKTDLINKIREEEFDIMKKELSEEIRLKIRSELEIKKEALKKEIFEQINKDIESL